MSTSHHVFPYGIFFENVAILSRNLCIVNAGAGEVKCGMSPGFIGS